MIPTEMNSTEAFALAEDLEAKAKAMVEGASAARQEAKRLRFEALPREISILTVDSEIKKECLKELCGEGVTPMDLCSSDYRQFSELVSALESAGWPVEGDLFHMALDFSLTLKEREAWKILSPGWNGTRKELRRACTEAARKAR